MKDQLIKLGKGSIIYGTGTALNQLLSILMLPVFTMYLLPEDFGIVAILTLLTFLLSSVFSLGFGTSMGICYFESADQRGRDQSVWTSFIILLVSSTCMVLIGLVFLEPLSNLLFSSTKQIPLVLLSFATTFFLNISTCFTQKLQFENRPAAYFWMMMISALLTISMSVFLVVILKRGAQGMIEGNLIGKAGYFLMFFISANKGSKPRFSYSIGKKLIKYGLPIIPGVISIYILQQGNVFSLEKFHSLEIAGLYAVGYSLGYAIQLLISGFSIAWYPFFMSYIEKQDEGKEIFGKIFTYLLFGIGLISLLFYVFSKPIILLFASSGYYDAYQIIGLTATAQMFFGLFAILNAPIILAKQPGYSTIFQVIATVLFIGLLFILIPNYGLLGAGFSLILGYVILDVIAFTWSYFNKKYMHIQYEYKKIILFIMLYGLSVVFMMWDKGLPLMLEIAVSFIAFILLNLLVFSLFDPSEKQFIYRLFTRSFYKKNLGQFKNGI